MVTEMNREKAKELLTNWSKWLITINMFAATGCIVGLKTAGETIPKVGIYFFAAVVSFGLSIVCATLFVFLMARLTLSTRERNTLSFIWLVAVQWVLFALGLGFAGTWIGVLSKVF
jgi:hypothetical protein